MGIKISKLLQQVSQHPQGSEQRRRAMHRLLIEIYNLPGLLKSSHPDYLAALNQTWEKVSRDICCEFQPRSKSLEKSLVSWINGYLYWRIKDLYSANSALISLDAPIAENDQQTTLIELLAETGLNTPKLNGLDCYIEQLQERENQRLSKKIVDYIDQDPQNQLKNCYPRAYPNCHCQLLSQKRLLSEPAKTFEDIAEELNIPLKQLTNHWYGRCKPLLQKIFQDYKLLIEVEFS
jgi:hypothetical protein